METLFEIVQKTEDMKKEGSENDNLFAGMPFMQDIKQGTLNPGDLTVEQLKEAIESSSYVNFPCGALVEELLWRLGGDEKEFDKVFSKIDNEEKQEMGVYDDDNSEEERGIYDDILTKKKREDTKYFAFVECKNHVLQGEIEVYLGYKPPYHYYTLYVRFKVLDVDALAKFGNKRLVEYYLSQDEEYIKTNIHFFARYGNIDVLKYLHEKCPWNKHTCLRAAAYGQLECLKYAHENGCPWDEEICIMAARFGHLDCLKYAHENECPWDENTCDYAAEYGHLECLKYAHENGCPWDEYTCEYASANGHLECLKYAHENGCPWDEYTYWWASNHNDEDMLSYLDENGCSKH